MKHGHEALDVREHLGVARTPGGGLLDEPHVSAGQSLGVVLDPPAEAVCVSLATGLAPPVDGLEPHLQVPGVSHLVPEHVERHRLVLGEARRVQADCDIGPVRAGRQVELDPELARGVDQRGRPAARASGGEDEIQAWFEPSVGGAGEVDRVPVGDGRHELGAGRAGEVAIQRGVQRGRLVGLSGRERRARRDHLLLPGAGVKTAAGVRGRQPREERVIGRRRPQERARRSVAQRSLEREHGGRPGPRRLLGRLAPMLGCPVARPQHSAKAHDLVVLSRAGNRGSTAGRRPTGGPASDVPAGS